MHELSLSLSVVRLVEERARAEGASRVLSVGVEVGRLGHVDPEALRATLAFAARDTLLATARFEIESPPGRAFCFDCAAEVPLERRGDPCPTCEGYALRIADGEQLRVASMEIV